MRSSVAILASSLATRFLRVRLIFVPSQNKKAAPRRLARKRARSAWARRIGDFAHADRLCHAPLPTLRAESHTHAFFDVLMFPQVSDVDGDALIRLDPRLRLREAFLQAAVHMTLAPSQMLAAVHSPRLS